jgi:hypothetical protein
MAEREWYPTNWVDEACPPARATPDDYIIDTGDGYRLGYKLGDPGICDDEVETFNEQLTVGDVVSFMCCDRLDDVGVTFRRDGSHHVHGELPEGYNWCRLEGDQDSLQETIGQLADHLAASLDVEETREVVELARWSDCLPHKFIIKDGKPAFEQVSAASVNN